MFLRLPKEESTTRIQRFYDLMEATYKDQWDTVLIVNRINQYYFTGTMQDGILVFKRNGDVHFFVRRSFERALNEGVIENIHKMQSYKDMLQNISTEMGNTFTETEYIPVAMLERIQKYFKMDKTSSIDRVMGKLRSIKSSYELSFMKESGRQHHHILTNVVPGLLREGMSETELMTDLYSAMMRLGHQGLNRFSGLQTEISVGQIGFGETTLQPTNFDGPGGMLGMSALLPSVAGRDRLLKKGDLVFIDIGYGYQGYHTDKTQVYSYKAKASDKAMRLHRECMKVQKAAADLLKPGSIPSNIYSQVTADISDELRENFMGYKERRVSFLGHGIGLCIDEYPVIAKGFDEPLLNNMVIALEPKTGIDEIGTVGVEDTYLITETGAKCLTGGGVDIIEIL